MSLRITVVDDNVDLVESLLSVLHHLGHDAEGATSGMDALLRMDERQPDIAFIDVGMPMMTGYQVAASVRKRPWGATPVLIALTGWDGSEDRAQARAAGFDQVVVKPVDLAYIRILLERVRARTPRELLAEPTDAIRR